MKKIFLLLIVLCTVCLCSCGGGSSSAATPDGGVSGWGFYDFFNGHTWYHTEGASKVTFTFSNRKVTRKDYVIATGVETYTSSEKSYVLSDVTGSGEHGTITTEELFENHPTLYVFLATNHVVFTYNGVTVDYYTD